MTAFGGYYNDVTMGSMAYQITSLTIVYIYSAVYWGADQRKHQSAASLAFVRGIHRGPVNSSRKWSVTRKMFPFDDAIMGCRDDLADSTVDVAARYWGTQAPAFSSLCQVNAMKRFDRVSFWSVNVLAPMCCIVFTCVLLGNKYLCQM